MAFNLVELLKEQFNEKAVSHLGTLLGETPTTIDKALTGVIPAVVGGVAHHIKDGNGSEAVLSIIRSAKTEANLTDSFADTARTQSAYATGEPLLTRIFGDRTQPVVNEISTYSGAKPASTTSLLKLAAATLMGLLTRQLAGTNSQTGAGLTSLMEEQADTVGNAVPSGLRNLLTIIGIKELATNTTAVKHSTTTAPVTTVVEDRTTGTPWLRWLLLALGILLLLWLLRDCFNKKETAVVTTDSTSVVAPMNTDTVASAVGTGDTTQANGPAVEVDVELPGGRRLKVAERSFNANLADYLAKKPKAPFRTFTFDNLTFATNSAAIEGESVTHVNELIEIMKAYPELVIRIEGHTDSTGDESTNEPLSQQRADAVKAALVQAGVAADRVTTKGFAAEKPTETNATKEGRQENRRIDVVIVKA